LHAYYTILTYVHHLFKSIYLLPYVNNSLRAFSYLYIVTIYHLLLLLGEA